MNNLNDAKTLFGTNDTFPLLPTVPFVHSYLRYIQMVIAPNVHSEVESYKYSRFRD